MGIVRNLTAGEIAGQVRVLARVLGPARGLVFNMVLMGMGEPLHNYNQTMRALGMLADEHGFAVTPRRVTLSTVGVLPGLERLATETFHAQPGRVAARDHRGATGRARASSTASTRLEEFISTPVEDFRSAAVVESRSNTCCSPV